MRLACIFLSALFLASIPAQGFDLLPEFGGLTAAEAAGFDRPERIDSEYQSDVLAYMPTLESDAAFYSRDSAFDLHLGSLSTKQFLHYDRLRLRKTLAEKLEFRFTRFTQRGLEDDEERNWLELVHWARQRLGFSVYGQVSREKEDIDLGAALLLCPDENLEVRLFYTWTDPEREARTQAGDVFVSSENPNSLGVAVHGRNEHGRFARYGFRRDLPGVWRFPRSGTDASHDKLTVWLESVDRRGGGATLETRAQWDKKSEARSPVAPAAFALESRERERLQVLLNLALMPPNLMWTAKPGIAYVNRKWTDESQATGRHRNLIPHFSVILPGIKRPVGRDKIELGYEATFFEAHGAGRFLNRGADYNAVEQRLNARYEIALADETKLAFLLSGDTDAGLTFEGGHGRFLVFF